MSATLPFRSISRAGAYREILLVQDDRLLAQVIFDTRLQFGSLYSTPSLTS
jgi:hypothetical protein